MKYVNLPLFRSTRGIHFLGYFPLCLNSSYCTSERNNMHFVCRISIVSSLSTFYGLAVKLITTLYVLQILNFFSSEIYGNTIHTFSCI